MSYIVTLPWACVANHIFHIILYYIVLCVLHILEYLSLPNLIYSINRLSLNRITAQGHLGSLSHM